MPGFEVRTLPIRELAPAGYNPRRPLTPQSPAYKKLRASLAAFGLVEPLVWNERTGRVVGGHARLRILKELGWRDVPVSVVRLTDAEERALNVVLNNSEAQGRYDPEKLAAVLAELESLPEMAYTGFGPGCLKSLRFTPAEQREPEPDVDRVEVTLVSTEAGYAAFATDLDVIVTTHDLEAHVRRG